MNDEDSIKMIDWEGNNWECKEDEMKWKTKDGERIDTDFDIDVLVKLRANEMIKKNNFNDWMKEWEWE